MPAMIAINCLLLLFLVVAHIKLERAEKQEDYLHSIIDQRAERHYELEKIIKLLQERHVI